MSNTLPHTCEGMVRAVEDPNVPVRYLPKLREFGLDHGDVIDVIDYCPWCGSRLPTSLRDAYLERLERLGLEAESRDVPLDLRTDAWWRMEGLS